MNARKIVDELSVSKRQFLEIERSKLLSVSFSIDKNHEIIESIFGLTGKVKFYSEIDKTTPNDNLRIAIHPTKEGYYVLYFLQSKVYIRDWMNEPSVLKFIEMLLEKNQEFKYDEGRYDLKEKIIFNDISEYKYDEVDDLLIESFNVEELSNLEELMLKLNDWTRSVEKVQIQPFPFISQPYLGSQRYPRKYYKVTESS